MRNYLPFSKLYKIKLTDWKITNLRLIFRLLLPLALGLGKISSFIIFHMNVAHIGENIVQPKSRDIRMMRPSRTEWVIVTKIVCPIVRAWRGEHTYQLIY